MIANIHACAFYPGYDENKREAYQPISRDQVHDPCTLCTGACLESRYRLCGKSEKDTPVYSISSLFIDTSQRKKLHEMNIGPLAYKKILSRNENVIIFHRNKSIY